MDDNGAGAREYRVEELAEAAGIPVRTLRFYRERRLLPPPRRAGRIAWYSEDHLSRLRTIAAKDHPCADFPKPSADGKYPEAVLLDLDYSVLMPRRA